MWVFVFNVGLFFFIRGCGELDGVEWERGLSFFGELFEIVRCLEEIVGGYLLDIEYDFDFYKMIDR